VGTREELHQILRNLSGHSGELTPDDMLNPGDDLSPGFNGVPIAVYFQADQNTEIEYPCIVYNWDDTWIARADNVAYSRKRRYQVTLISGDPDDPIADRIEELPFTRFLRTFRTDGLNHFVFQIFF
jgi:hypothetical protein